ncbi:MAG TPA: alpha-E domain-containing protein [Caulobacteraceae bacterium]
MMLARVADSLYWLGRYLERAEHLSRLSEVMLTATLDHTEAAEQAAHMALSAVGDTDIARAAQPYEAAKALVLDRADPNSVVISLARARENARQVRDQLTSETWERLNMLFLKVTAEDADEDFHAGASAWLHEIIADLHLFKGAADATMSHGEGWRFLMLGAYIERAQLIARLLETCFGDGEAHKPTDHIALMSLLRMACALEPYLRVYTAEMEPRLILEFLLLNEDFPRSIRFATGQIEEDLDGIASQTGADVRHSPARLAGRLNARLRYADIDELRAEGATALLETILDECAAIHQAIYDTFVAYPLEQRLPA